MHVLRHLALCHTVIIDPKSLEYSASSPDEKALVLGAKKHGVEFVDRNQKKNQDFISIRYPNKKKEKFQILDVLEFNSTRKRMSVILRNVQTKQLELLCKGADSIIEPLLSKGGGERPDDWENDQNLQR